MADQFTLESRPPRRVLPVIAPSTTPSGTVLAPALDFGSAHSTVPRTPRSVRRTSHLDSLIQGDRDAGRVMIRGAARDLRTGSEAADATVVAAATVETQLDAALTVQRLVTTPELSTLHLVGRTIGRGFRAALDEAVPAERDASTPLYLLLDDLPVILVITGYARQFSDDVRGGSEAGRLRNVCAGFRDEGVMMRSFDERGTIPISIGPVAGPLGRDDDPLAWHEIGELAPGAMRRRRLVEVRGGAEPTFYAYFRDTYRASLDEPEIVMHEYQIHGSLDADGHTVSSCVADPLTLPWPECPHAAGSAAWIVGQTTDDIRDVVRVRFRGTDTCTHLNDLIRSLGDLSALGAAIA